MVKACIYNLIRQSAKRHFTGSCDDLSKRFERHNSALVPSTKYGVPWTLIWYQACESRSEARRPEIRIKKRGAKRFLSDKQKQR
jgi:putative endonuclease